MNLSHKGNQTNGEEDNRIVDSAAGAATPAARAGASSAHFYEENREALREMFYKIQDIVRVSSYRKDIHMIRSVQSY